MTLKSKSQEEWHCRVYAEARTSRSFVRDRRIVTIPFKFGSDRHYGIKRDLDRWIRGPVSRSRLMKEKPEVGKG
jgi:hypothetical protein